MNHSIRDAILVTENAKKATMTSTLAHVSRSYTRTNFDTPKKHAINSFNKTLQTYNHTVGWNTERTEEGYHRLKKTFEQLFPKGPKGRLQTKTKKTKVTRLKMMSDAHVHGLRLVMNTR